MVASGTASEIRKTIDEYAEARLDYFCASIMHSSAAETKADLRRFAREVVRSYA